MYTRRKFLQLTAATGSLVLLPPLLFQNETIIEPKKFLAKFYKSGNFILEGTLAASIFNSNRLHLVYRASRLIEFDEIKVYKDNVLIKAVHEHLTLFPSDTMTLYWNI